MKLKWNMIRPRLLFLITEDWYFWSHRRVLAQAARESGFEILLATRVQDLGDAIRDCGITLIPIRLRRANRNPLNELLSLWQLVAIYRREQPTIVHHVGVADADELSKPYTVRYHHGALYHVFGYGCRPCS